MEHEKLKEIFNQYKHNYLLDGHKTVTPLMDFNNFKYAAWCIENSSPVEPEVSQENGGQWIYAGDKLPEKNRVVITYDNKEERDIDKYGCDFIYADPNGKLHWDWHFDDNDFYWKDFSRFSG
jgi:hypothetical protein